MEMKYEQALKIGRARAEQAAETIRRWASVKACAVCALKPSLGGDQRRKGHWEPVGKRSYKEIARDEGMRDCGNFQDSKPTTKELKHLGFDEIYFIKE